MHGRRRSAAASAAAGLLAGALLLSACSGTSGSSGAAAPARPSATPVTTADSPAPEPTEEPLPAVPVPTLALAEPTSNGKARFDEPVRLVATDGTLVSATVATKGGRALEGAVEGGSAWSSARTGVPGATYLVAATVADANGVEHDVTSDFRVTKVPQSRRLALDVLPSTESVVGIGAPVVVTFDQEVTDQAAVEEALEVYSDPVVTGAWYWVNDAEVHFRPKEFWKQGTRVRVDLNLNGVEAGDDLWGARSYRTEFTVGDRRIASVDAADHRFRLYVDGKRRADWPTSLGKPGFSTRNGTYIVLGKQEDANMTSCGLGTTCDEDDPEYYDLDVKWNTRITNSGTFIHAAPWSVGSQGSANVSHGCINLSTDRAHSYYSSAKYGDVVTVKGTPRSAKDLLDNDDPGMADWNRPWASYVESSALGAPVQTLPLTDDA